MNNIKSSDEILHGSAKKQKEIKWRLLSIFKYVLFPI